MSNGVFVVEEAIQTNKHPIRFLSLFSGIEAASVAWCPLGWECVAVAEIEKFPSAVLAHHYPTVPNLGDITKITQEQIESLGHIDVVIFGFPCQDLSVAGKRAGLRTEDGEVTRSGLFFDAMRIVRWSRARWALAENVPGLLSSKQGADFAAVVGEMAGTEPNLPKGKWQNSGFLLGADGLVEWATLDAQHFGVPQRRRRVFIVRDIGDWSSRSPILLEPESLLGNPAPSRKEEQEVARGSTFGIDEECNVTDNGYGPLLRDDQPTWPASVVQTLDTTYGDKMGLDNQHINGGGGQSLRSRPCWWDGGQLSQTLDAVLAKGQCMPEKNRFPAVLVDEPVVAFGGNNTSGPIEVATAVNACSSASGRLDFESETFLVGNMAVRRLLPVECERLQGFPDGHTLLPTKKQPDGPRYKTLGNSMAVPVISWIGKRIQEAHNG